MSVNSFKGILISIFLAAILLPVGIQILVDVDTSGWDPTLVTIWDNIPIIVGIVILIGFISWIGVSRRGGFGVAAPVLAIPVFSNEFALFSMSAVLVAYFMAKQFWGFKHRKIPRSEA